MVSPSMREEWRCVLEGNGGLCVVTFSGLTMMLKLCADSWDLTLDVCETVHVYYVQSSF